MDTRIVDPSQVSEGRRFAVEFARRTGADDSKLARIALIATEMATNLIKHGGGGILVVEGFDDADGAGIELMALDQGAGMADVGKCLADGYSTAGSPGTGFGAIARQSDRLAVFSRPGLGTAVMARLILEPAATPPSGTAFGVVSAPHPAETVCGDHWAFGAGKAGRTVLVVDGSGHGPEAARAARLATQIFGEHFDEDCAKLVERLHRGLAQTRGAALAVARVDDSQPLVRFVGIGNIAGAVAYDGEVRRMVSHNGTAGHIAPRIREFTYPFAGNPVVILHSDGLSARWELGGYPGLAASHPSLIAGVLFRDHRRGRDDATIVAMRGA
jgi:anti-sigma regulatory factor (Ser/Thr protein kinase)